MDTAVFMIEILDHERKEVKMIQIFDQYGLSDYHDRDCRSLNFMIENPDHEIAVDWTVRPLTLSLPLWLRTHAGGAPGGGRAPFARPGALFNK